MEFADLILASKVDRVCLYYPKNVPLEGILCITGHHLIISSRKEGGQEIWLLHSNVDHIDRKPWNNIHNTGSLILKCKDFRILQLELYSPEDLTNVAVTLERLISIEDIIKLYPMFYRPMYSIIEDGWTAFRPETEFNKLVTTYSDEWRISYLNQDFKVCPTYPSAVVVPKNIDDESIIATSGFRSGGRFPVLSYRHETGSVLLRSSQPLVGPANKRCKQDEKILNSLLGPGKRGFIIDTRSQSVAQSAKAKGGGFELEMFYPQWRRVHRSLDENSLDSLTKLVQACNDKNMSMDKFLNKLDSGWLSNVGEVLNSACIVAQCLDQEPCCILVHGGDGLDNTLLVTTLAQVILNPDCRTIRGIQAVVEREWLQGGHPFSSRHQKSCYSQPNARTTNNSATFLVLLDCLAQLHYQFPCSFEYNHEFLISLFEHSYSSQFGTFLGNCEADRDAMKLSEKTVSLWSYMNRPDILHSYLNTLYDPNTKITWPSVAPVSLSLWSELFLRWVVDFEPSNKAAAAIAALKAKSVELRQRAGRLRRQLADLEKEAENVGLLPAL